MKRILRGAIFAAEIVASVIGVDVGFSLIVDPSMELRMAGIGLLFLAGAFWYYRIQVMKHRREQEGGNSSEANVDSALNKLEHFARGTFRGRMRDTNWPGKRGN
jgi:membrane protein implicated in regulation of membrane protease activity